MSTKSAIEFILGFAVAMSVITALADEPPQPNQPASLNEPTGDPSIDRVMPAEPAAVAPPETAQPAKNMRLTRSRDPKMELGIADAAYREAVRDHGENSPSAKRALKRLNKAQAAVELAAKEQADEAVQGGAGRTGGELQGGSSE